MLVNSEIRFSSQVLAGRKPAELETAYSLLLQIENSPLRLLLDEAVSRVIDQEMLESMERMTTGKQEDQLLNCEAKGVMRGISKMAEPFFGLKKVLQDALKQGS